MNKFLLSTIFVFFSLAMFSQTKTINGIITNEEGEPLIAATVRNISGSEGTITDLNGEFSLVLPVETQRISVSYVGYDPQTIDISNTTNVKVVMSNSSLIQEVVVKGFSAYGSGKSQLTGATSIVKADQIENVPMGSFDQMLQGKAAGVTVLSGTGQPGEIASVRIRGPVSISGSNTPLYLLDGVEIDQNEFQSLNPNDFESINFLKDAASQAIYGSRASAGVVAITTKKGSNSKPIISYDVQYGSSEIGNYKFDMMDSEELLAFQKVIRRGPGWSLSAEANPNATTDQLAANANRLAQLRSTNTQWDQVFFNTGTTVTQNFSVNGGNDKTKYYFSLAKYDQEGIARGSFIDRYTGRLNLDFEANENVRFFTNMTLGNAKSSYIRSENGINLNNMYAQAYLAPPYETPYNDDGSYNLSNWGGRTLQSADMNPVLRNRLKIFGKMGVEIDLFKDLITSTTTFGGDYQTRNTEAYTDPASWSGSNNVQGNQGNYNRSDNSNFIKDITQTFDFDKKINDQHYIDGLIGLEAIKRENSNFGYTGYGINPKLVGSPASLPPASKGADDAAFIPDVFGGQSESGLYSLFTALSYKYDEKYTFQGSFRRDGSSHFGPNNKWGNFYSLSFLWDAISEPFLDDVDWMSNLSVRASIGTVGNDVILGGDNYPYLTRFGTTNYNGLDAIAPSSLGNSDFKWETKETINFGVDFGFLKNRITGALDIYQDKTKDLFIQQQLPIEIGVGDSRLDVNAGKMRNKGFDLGLNTVVFTNSDITVQIGGNVNYNKNKITSLGQVNQFEQGTSIIRVGEALGSHYVVEWRGVDPATGAPLYSDSEGNVTAVYSGNNRLTKFGTYIPPWKGGFNAKVDLYGFQLSTDFSFMGDYSRFNNQTFFQENTNFAQYNLLRIMNTIWQNPGDVTEVQGASYAREFTSKDVEDASFVKFRNLRLAYNLPQNVMSKVPYVSNISFFGMGTNLYTWTKFTGFDPEDNNNIAGYEYPSPRTLTIGLNVKF